MWRVPGPGVLPVGRKVLVLPDTQVKPGVPLDHFRWIGRYAARKCPDYIVHLGDHWDMHSLSSYDSDKRKAFEGRAKKADIDWGNKALEILQEELDKGGWKGDRYILEGNHDGFAPGGRVYRYLVDHPDDEGLITPDMFADSWLGWKRIPFLQPIDLDGVLYCHLFPYNLKGECTGPAQRNGAASPEIQLRAVMQSATAGHKQGLRWGYHNTPFRTLQGIIAGSCYLHDEEYLGGARYWRGIIMKHDLRDTNPNHYDVMPVSLTFLKRKFG